MILSSDIEQRSEKDFCKVSITCNEKIVNARFLKASATCNERQVTCNVKIAEEGLYKVLVICIKETT